MFGKVCLIFLHGSGSNGQDIAGYLDSVPIPAFGYETFRDIASNLSIDIVTPTADTRRYTAMGGERCNVWFDRSADFMSRGLRDSEDFEGAELSLGKVLSIFQKVEKSYDHVFFGGFSMGGGLALHALKKDQPTKLRGIFTMGSFLVQESAVVTGPLGRASRVPVLMMHGESDSMIRCEWGRQTAANLLLRDVDVQFRTYPQVDHELDTSELADLLLWVKDVLFLHQQKECESDAKAVSSSSEAYSKDDGTASDRRGGSSSSSRVADAKSGDFDRSSHKQQATSAGLGDKYHDEEEDKDDQDNHDAAFDSSAAVAGSLAQLQVDQQSQQKQSQQKTPSAPPSAVSLAEKAGMHIPYTIEYLQPPTSATGAAGKRTSASPSVRLHFSVPRDLINVLTARPVLACGSMFEIMADEPNGVKVQLQSADPHSTAVQIGLRLQNRISGGSASLNPCPVS